MNVNERERKPLKINISCMFECVSCYPLNSNDDRIIVCPT